jgi:hypothetical protein
VHGDGWEVGQNEEELKGNRFRSLPCAGVLWRGGSTAGGGVARGGGRAALVVTMEGSGRRGNWSWRCGCHGEPRRAFYRRGKVGSGRYFELRGALMAGNGGSGKIPAWTPADGILGRFCAVRIDLSCRGCCGLGGETAGE